MATVLPNLLLLVGLAYAIVGGVFLAFSDFIIRSLVLSSTGAETMQHINREVFRWIFMALFLGLAPVSLGISLYAYWALSGAASALIVAGGLCYVMGVFGVTVVRNVPLNTELGNLPTPDPATTTYWQDIYVPRWTFWNSVRTGACILSALLVNAGIVLLHST